MPTITWRSRLSSSRCHQYRTNFWIGHSIKEMLNAKNFFGIKTEVANLPPTKG